MTKFVVHVGAHKTGTTVIQESLRRLMPELSVAGIQYEHRHGDICARHRLTEIAREAMGAQRLGRQHQNRFRRLFRELREAHEPTDTVVLSNEVLMGLYSPRHAWKVGRLSVSYDSGQKKDPMYRGAGRMAKLLRGASSQPMKIVIYVRRQDGWFESFDSHHIRTGTVPSGLGIRSWMRTASWQSPAAAFAGEFGDENVIVKNYRLPSIGAARYVQDFLVDACGYELEMDVPELDPVASNRGLSDRGTEIAARMSDLLFDADERRDLGRYLVKNFSKDAAGRNRSLDFSDEEVAWFEADVAATIERWGSASERAALQAEVRSGG